MRIKGGEVAAVVALTVAACSGGGDSDNSDRPAQRETTTTQAAVDFESQGQINTWLPATVASPEDICAAGVRVEGTPGATDDHLTWQPFQLRVLRQHLEGEVQLGLLYASDDGSQGFGVLEFGTFNPEVDVEGYENFQALAGPDGVCMTVAANVGGKLILTEGGLVPGATEPVGPRF